MAKHELLEGYSDFYKSIHGFRPRGQRMTMETPIEEIEAAWEALTPSRNAHEDASFTP